MRRIWLLFVVGILLLVGSACDDGEVAAGVDSEKKLTINISTPDADTASVSLAAKEFSEIVAEKSEGSIEVKVHPNGTLYGGDPSAAVKQLGAGSLDMLILSTSLYANFEPKFSAISVPYLFDNKEQFVSFLNDDLGQELLGTVTELDIEGLGYWTRDFRQITNSKRPITQPSDLEGVKLRVPNNPLWVEFFKLTGTVTTPMDFGEVYNALQLKTIDGQENPLAVITSSKLYEVQEYLTISNHMADGWLVGMNKKKFDGLNEVQRDIIEESVEYIQSWLLDYDEEESKKSIQHLQDEGVKVNELSQEQQQQFVEVSKQAYPQFKGLIKDDEFFSKVLDFVGKQE